jgi:hypothetical protein
MAKLKGDLLMRKLIFTIIVLSFASTSAYAALVTDWSLGVVGTFDASSVVWNGSSAGTSATGTQLLWGTSTGSGQSGLNITNPAGATNIVTDGPAVANMSITHLNRPITGTSLLNVDLISTLSLTPVVPAGPLQGPYAQTFTIKYAETTNNLNPCPDGGVNGVGINANGCADIFAIDYRALNFPFIYDTDGAGGDDPRTYYLSFFEITNGLNPLTDDACTAAGGGPNCLGFETSEGQDTTAIFAALITSEPVSPVPEPGTLFLMGAGFVSLALFGRKRMQNI